MLNLHRDKKSQGVNRGEMRRYLMTTGRMVTLRPIGYTGDEKKNEKKEEEKNGLISYSAYLSGSLLSAHKEQSRNS